MRNACNKLLLSKRYFDESTLVNVTYATRYAEYWQNLDQQYSTVYNRFNRNDCSCAHFLNLNVTLILCKFGPDLHFGVLASNWNYTSNHLHCDLWRNYGTQLSAHGITSNPTQFILWRINLLEKLSTTKSNDAIRLLTHAIQTLASEFVHSLYYGA